MTEKLQIAKAFLSYLLKAGAPKVNESVFISQFYHEVIASEKYYYQFEDLEILRSDLQKNSRKIEIKDLGAGSKVDKSSQRKISSIAKHTVSNTKTGEFLFKLVNYLQPKTIIELGTSLGVNTLYLAMASKNTKVFTLEGCPNTLAVAEENFRKLGVTNIETIEGNIDATLSELLKNIHQADIIYFDANHQKTPTLNYFQLCLPHITEQSIFIFDDIYWSKGMMEAWEQIASHPTVSLSIDLFDLGIIFFDKSLPKEKLILKF